MKKKKKKPLTVEQKIKRRNLISFGTFFVLGGAGFGGWKWLTGSPKEAPGVTAGAQKPLRRALNSTELFFKKIFSNNHLVQTYPKSRAARRVRTNSFIGLRDPSFKLEEWRLSVLGDNGEVLSLCIDEIKALPKTEIVYDFKCVEGWDQIQHWAGVKMLDFIQHFKLEELARRNYVGLETPDGKYYVGLDRESAFHPQTILAYEMNDQPITDPHGAPLRLIIPVKYGIKNLKRIGSMRFSDTRPRDYWAEQGYDYYSGL
ncbi:MAG: molybdopterin-dependent oxidoreductase [Bacteroidetes bacterium]|nr:molybdopterin-dependent oxidoreductase [Bacteroidota bacterium]